MGTNLGHMDPGLLDNTKSFEPHRWTTCDGFDAFISTVCAFDLAVNKCHARGATREALALRRADMCSGLQRCQVPSATTSEKRRHGTGDRPSHRHIQSGGARSSCGAHVRPTKGRRYLHSIVCRFPVGSPGRFSSPLFTRSTTVRTSGCDEVLFWWGRPSCMEIACTAGVSHSRARCCGNGNT